MTIFLPIKFWTNWPYWKNYILMIILLELSQLHEELRLLNFSDPGHGTKIFLDVMGLYTQTLKFYLRGCATITKDRHCHINPLFLDAPTISATSIMHGLTGTEVNASFFLFILLYTQTQIGWNKMITYNQFHISLLNIYIWQ